MGEVNHPRVYSILITSHKMVLYLFNRTLRFLFICGVKCWPSRIGMREHKNMYKITETDLRMENE
jgi:hypothetical protein